MRHGSSPATSRNSNERCAKPPKTSSRLIVESARGSCEEEAEIPINEKRSDKNSTAINVGFSIEI